jgi:hypothetical protein
MSLLPPANSLNVGHTRVCVCACSAPGPPKSRQLTAFRPLTPAMLHHVDPLKARLGSTSPSNLSALCRLSVYNTDLGYHHALPSSLHSNPHAYDLGWVQPHAHPVCTGFAPSHIDLEKKRSIVYVNYIY